MIYVEIMVVGDLRVVVDEIFTRIAGRSSSFVTGPADWCLLDGLSDLGIL